MREAMTKQEVIQAIERKGDHVRVPLFMCKWWGDGLAAKYGQETLDAIAAKYPDDIVGAFYQDPGEALSPNGNPRYRWGFKDYTGKETHSIGQLCVLMDEWSEFDRFKADFPNPNEPGAFDGVKRAVDNAGGRYVLGAWWKLFHERFWSIRGMENLMYDYYDAMDELKELGWLLVEYYKAIVDRFVDAGVDGIFTSDDLGHQQGPMMSPAMFKELYLPLYKEIISYVHSKGLHFFLHSCGDNTLLMDDLIEAGLDVFHPIQVGCMDFHKTAATYGDRLSFLAGVDVQHLLPEGSTEQVRAGIAEMVRAIYTPKGGLLLAAGNGIMPDIPLENIDAMLDAVTNAV